MIDVAETGERPPSWLELEAVIPLDTTQPGVTTVKTVTSLSSDNVKRNFPGFVVRLSPKREGMKLRNALMIAAGKATITTP